MLHVGGNAQVKILCTIKEITDEPSDQTQMVKIDGYVVEFDRKLDNVIMIRARKMVGSSIVMSRVTRSVLASLKIEGTGNGYDCFHIKLAVSTLLYASPGNKRPQAARPFFMTG